jgi:tetratricopeptide (TPR) repeat protein
LARQAKGQSHEKWVLLANGYRNHCFELRVFSSTANAQTFSQARANVCLQQKDWTALANYAAAWTQAQPNSVDAWSDLAVAESTTGLNQPTEAISAFKHVLALQPNFAAAWEGLGVNELAISQAGSAIDALTHATRLEPNNPHFLNNLAAAYRDKGEIASALKTLDSEKLLAERLHDAAVWFVLGVVLQSLRVAKGSPAEPSLSDHLEEAGNEFRLSFHVVPFDPRYLPLSDHRHCLKSRHCSSRRLETAEAKPWPGQPFDASMILLDDVIEVFDLTQFGATP